MEEIKINPLEEIKTVKVSGNGYLLNGTMSVPMADGNREYELIKLWISEGNTPEPEFSEEELEAIAEEQTNIAAKEQRAAAMLEGDIYPLAGVDYRVSFTKDDGDGLMQVKSAFELGLASTIIYFANGAKMPITAEEFEAFAVWFVNKRNEFFV